MRKKTRRRPRLKPGTRNNTPKYMLALLFVQSTINTNALPVIHAAAMQFVAQKAGYNLSQGQIEELMGAAGVAARWLHLEIPLWGRAIHRAGQWIEGQGGYRTILRRLAGPQQAAAGQAPAPGGSPQAAKLVAVAPVAAVEMEEKPIDRCGNSAPTREEGQRLVFPSPTAITKSANV